MGRGIESGQTTAEYAIFVGLFAVLLIVGIVLLRGGVTNAFERSGAQVASFRPPATTCDSRYLGGCVPAYPPDVDCSDLETLGLTQVTLAGPEDPHGLDPDGDGIACD